MTSPRNERDDLAQIVSTPEDVSDNVLTTRRSASAEESIGMMPLILGAAAVALVALLGGEPALNQLSEPRSGQTSTPPK